MKNNYIAALDGIRFLAVMLVVIDHWSGHTLGFPAAYLGVCLFFVLSGFLITRILLNAKQKDEQLQRGHGFSLRQFYIRRTIRIFPIYYLTLAVLFVLNVPPVREKIWWLVSYNTNNFIALHQTWLGSSDHLWSLAVEEQFYLFFPFLIFTLTFKRIPSILGILIAFSVGLRLFFFSIGTSWIVSYVLMFTCLDAFGIGGLLAYYYWTENAAVKQFFQSWKPLIVSLFVYILALAISNFLPKSANAESHNIIMDVFIRFFESLVSVALIGKVAWGFSLSDDTATIGLHKFLMLPVVVYIGKISYGIYLYHNYIYNVYHTPATHPTARILAKITELSPALGNSIVFKISLLVAVVIALASVSWYIIEKPINALKEKYGY